ncbi:MAG: site-specific integrase [Methanomicrobia archaeon]|nr:site-specific integrase [Methanomicrobia archaeon]
MTQRELEEETEKLVESFYNYLTVEKGLSEETASRHVGQIEFFAFRYLVDYNGKSLLDASGSDIEDYLGNWYIRKVMNSTKSDVRPILVAFKKFFKFLSERGEIDKEQLGDILSACEDPQTYIRRFETYFELDQESEAWDADFENWLMGSEEDIEEDYEQPHKVNEVINRAFSEKDLKSSKTTVLEDFQTFVKYVSENSGMKLTAANSFFVRKHVLALNEAMNSPEELKSTANQPDSRTIHLFYNLSRTLGLFAVSARNTLEITPRRDIFGRLSPNEQFVMLFDAMWTETSWEKFLAPYSGGRPEWAQSIRGEIALLFSRCEPGEPYPLKEVLSQVGMAKGHTEYDFVENIVTVAEIMIGVFGERIMQALTLFGLLDFGFTKERDNYFVRHGVGIEWFSITKFGKKLFRVLAQDG